MDGALYSWANDSGTHSKVLKKKQARTECIHRLWPAFSARDGGAIGFKKNGVMGSPQWDESESMVLGAKVCR